MTPQLVRLPPLGSPISALPTLNCHCLRDQSVSPDWTGSPRVVVHARPQHCPEQGQAQRGHQDRAKE